MKKKKFLIERSVSIYALSCNGTVFYVGKSFNPYSRFDHHKSLSKTSNYKLYAWWKQKRNEGAIFTMNVIEETLIPHREYYWLNYFINMGFDMQNTINKKDEIQNTCTLLDLNYLKISGVIRFANENIGYWKCRAI